jgi:hypothetical protein
MKDIDFKEGRHWAEEVIFDAIENIKNKTMMQCTKKDENNEFEMIANWEDDLAWVASPDQSEGSFYWWCEAAGFTPDLWQNAILNYVRKRQQNEIDFDPNALDDFIKKNS